MIEFQYQSLISSAKSIISTVVHKETKANYYVPFQQTKKVKFQPEFQPIK